MASNSIKVTLLDGECVIECFDGEGHDHALDGSEFAALTEFILSRAITGIDREKLARWYYEQDYPTAVVANGWDTEISSVRYVYELMADALIVALPALLTETKP